MALPKDDPAKRFLVASGFFLIVVITSCSATRSTITGSTCREEPAAATLMYPEAGARNVATSLSQIVLSGADTSGSAKISLIDAGGRQIALGRIGALPQVSTSDGVATQAATVNGLAPEMNYIVLYSPVGCAGAMDYAIGSFTTE